MPNGENLGYAFGDYDPSEDVEINNNGTDASNVTIAQVGRLMSSATGSVVGQGNQISPHPWGIFFTILGTVLLDFDADACQSPARAYLLDVTIPGKLSLLILKYELFKMTLS